MTQTAQDVEPEIAKAISEIIDYANRRAVREYESLIGLGVAVIAFALYKSKKDKMISK